MVLSDHSIREELAEGRIVIDPLGEGCIQPASVDLHLDRQIGMFLPPDEYSFVDIRRDLTGLTIFEEIPDPLPYVLSPGQFILASTVEHVELPDDIVARLEGKSSLGRLGLLIHSTAGYVDPGWKGQLTLEISNVAEVKITLYYGMKISQISFLRLSTPADNPYGSRTLGSKYQGQIGPTPTRSHLEFDGTRDRLYSPTPTELKKWLDDSAFAGNVRKLALVLQVPQKTVEDWVYGRNEPNSQNRARLFEMTGLTGYAPSQTGQQASLFSSEQDGLL